MKYSDIVNTYSKKIKYSNIRLARGLMYDEFDRIIESLMRSKQRIVKGYRVVRVSQEFFNREYSRHVGNLRLFSATYRNLNSDLSYVHLEVDPSLTDAFVITDKRVDRNREGYMMEYGEVLRSPLRHISKKKKSK